MLKLQHALAIELGDKAFDVDNIPETEGILSVCAGLITLNEETRVARLVHYTTQQYFEKTWNTWFPDAHREIGRVCLTFLSLDAFRNGICETQEEFLSRLNQFPLYNYASRNWGYHIQHHCGPIEEELALELLSDAPKAAACSQALTIGRQHLWTSKTRKQQMTGMHLAAYWGLSNVLKLLIDNDNAINVEDPLKRTPLSWASKNGHEKEMRVLLENRANPDCKDKYGQTPLFHAVHNGQEDATNVLLEYGANPQEKDANGQNLLSRAAEYGHISIVHKFLLAKLDDTCLNSKDNSGQTALARAVQSGQDEVVKLLLEQGADPNTKDNQGLTPLFRALSICRRRLLNTTNSDELNISLSSKDNDDRWKTLNVACAQR